MKRTNRHYENYQTEIGRPLTSEEERILDIAESYITTDPKDPLPDPQGTNPASPESPEK